MLKSLSIAPSNSLLFVHDASGGKIPEITRDQRIWSTASCVAFGCLMFQDGETEVTLGPSAEMKQASKPAFDQYIETPTLSIVVSTVEDDVVMQSPVPTRATRVRIWTNHASEPDKVAIGLN